MLHNVRCTCQRSFGSSLRSHFMCSFASELGRYVARATTAEIKVVRSTVALRCTVASSVTCPTARGRSRRPAAWTAPASRTTRWLAHHAPAPRSCATRTAHKCSRNSSGCTPRACAHGDSAWVSARRSRPLAIRRRSRAPRAWRHNESLQLTRLWGWRVLRTRSYLIPCN